MNIDREFEAIAEYWSPRVIAQANGQYVKLAKVKGEFVWHHHDNEDELFLVVRGTMRMKFREHGAEREEKVRPGEFIIVPKGVEHMPIADEEVHVMLLEPKSTLNTGNVRNERTLETLQRI
jgi:mannose-6-phosphate isomerase-like protein (cupin superfamily)